MPRARCELTTHDRRSRRRAHIVVAARRLPRDRAASSSRGPRTRRERRFPPSARRATPGWPGLCRSTVLLYLLRTVATGAFCGIAWSARNIVGRLGPWRILHRAHLAEHASRIPSHAAFSHPADLVDGLGRSSARTFDRPSRGARRLALSAAMLGGGRILWDGPSRPSLCRSGLARAALCGSALLLALGATRVE